MGCAGADDCGVGTWIETNGGEMTTPSKEEYMISEDWHTCVCDCCIEHGWHGDCRTCMKLQEKKMTTEHDFKKAAQELAENIDHTGFPYEGSICGGAEGEMVLSKECVDTIRFALRLAHKLLKHEPSEGMWRSAMGLRNEDNDFDPDYDRVLQAMIEQAVKEIENEIQK